MKCTGKVYKMTLPWVTVAIKLIKKTKTKVLLYELQ